MGSSIRGTLQSQAKAFLDSQHEARVSLCTYMFIDFTERTSTVFSFIVDKRSGENVAENSYTESNRPKAISILSVAKR